ncbi:16S rRNA m2G966 methyltransferase [Synechococcus sp. BIOS-E4-1]|nr:16S rRNA m2G966 methyltransferase [Synechococcus sp. BIOS-E4-1]
MAAVRRAAAPVKGGQLRLIGGRRLRSPQGQGTRPTTARVREALMNLLSSEIRGCYWLDLCSGSGVMGCEALIRGASHVVAVEKDARTAAICRENLELVAANDACDATVNVIRKDLLSWLKQGCLDGNQRFSIVYFDPPYGSGLYRPALSMLHSGGWVQPQGLVICEFASREKFEVPSGWKETDRRQYGKSSLLILNPQEHCRGDTDSKLRQTGREG